MAIPSIPSTPTAALSAPSLFIQECTQFLVNNFQAPEIPKKETDKFFKSLSTSLQLYRTEKKLSAIHKILFTLCAQLQKEAQTLPIAALEAYRSQEKEILSSKEKKARQISASQLSVDSIFANDPVAGIQFFLLRKESLSSTDLRLLENMLERLQANQLLISKYMSFHFIRRLFYANLGLISHLSFESVNETRILDWSKIQPNSIEAISLARKIEEEMHLFHRTRIISPETRDLFANYQSLDPASRSVIYLFGIDLLLLYLHDFNVIINKISDEEFLIALQLYPQTEPIHLQTKEICAFKYLKTSTLPREEASALFTKLNLVVKDFKDSSILYLTYKEGYTLFNKQTTQSGFVKKEPLLLSPEKFEQIPIPTIPSCELFDTTFFCNEAKICEIFSSEDGIYCFLHEVSLTPQEDIKQRLTPRGCSRPPIKALEIKKKDEGAAAAASSDFLPKELLLTRGHPSSPSKSQTKKKHPKVTHKSSQAATEKAPEKETPKVTKEDPTSLNPPTKTTATAKELDRNPETDPDCPQEKPINSSFLTVGSSAPSHETSPLPIPPLHGRITAKVAHFIDSIKCSERELLEALKLSKMQIHLHVKKAFWRRDDLLETASKIDDETMRHIYPTSIASIVRQYGLKQSIFSSHRSQADDSYQLLGSIQKKGSAPLLGNFTEGFFSKTNQDGPAGMLFHHCFVPWSRQEIFSYITKNAFQSPTKFEDCSIGALVDEHAEQVPRRYSFNVFKYRLVLSDKQDHIKYTLAFPRGVPHELLPVIYTQTS